MTWADLLFGAAFSAVGKQEMPEPERPGTSASIALSSIGSLASRTTASSASGSRLNELVHRRSQLRAQLQLVEQQLQHCPPSTAAGSVGGAHADARGGGGGGGPARSAATPSSHPRLRPTPAREPKAPNMPPVPPMTRAQLPPPSSADEALPGAMQPGRYAFWPKRLPGARRSFARATDTAPPGTKGTLDVRGAVYVRRG